ncbi:MAG: hypothetical protein COB78_07105 [Hyphomicrobiales bacterium]|nr:MAG: hypothetical protein COB78_07105 [Hyphomicrobiales bacterium]
MTSFKREEPTLGEKIPLEIVQLASGFSEIGESYPADLDRVPLESLPILRKAHFRSVKDSLLNRARKRSGGAVILGSGGTTSEPLISVIPSGMFLKQIRQVWDPLKPDDVVANLNVGGELGSMFPFFSSLCDVSNAVSVPLGPLGDQKAVERWLPFFEAVGVTTLAGTPTQMSIVLGLLNETNRRLSTLKKLIWTGEAFSAAALEEVKRYGPLEMYGAYGSTETWVIGVSYPECPVGTFHWVPYQHVEFVEGQVTVTCLDTDCINPIVRYQPGDHALVCECACGRPRAFSVEGRADEQVKFLSILFYPREPYDVVSSHPDVHASQIILIDNGSPQERMEVQVVLNVCDGQVDIESATRSIRDHLLGKLYRLAHETHDRPERIVVRAVEQLNTNPRTMKTPYIVYRSSKKEG